MAGRGAWFAVAVVAVSLFIADVTVVVADVDPGVRPAGPALKRTTVGEAPKGPLVYVTHAESEDIAAFTVGRDGRPRRLGDLVPTGAGTRPSPVMFAPDGRTSYVLNRGNNTVAAYRVGPRGELRLLGTAPTGDAFGLALAPDGPGTTAHCNGSARARAAQPVAVHP